MDVQGRLAVVVVWMVVVAAVAVPFGTQRWVDSSVPVSLADAVWRGDMAAVAAAREDEIDRENDGGWTLLMTAAEFGRERVAELLIERGADVNALSPGGQTALMLAAGDGHVGTVRVLLGHGADVTRVTMSGKDALAAAAGAGYAGCVRLLLEAGGDPFRPSYNGETAIGSAIEQGNWECVWEIVAYRFWASVEGIQAGAASGGVKGRRAR